MTQYFSSLRSFAAGSALLILLVPTVQAAEQPTAPPSVDARAWILMDYASGKVLAEGNADEKLDPASLTKIMTSYVVGQALKAGKINLNDMVTVGKDAWATGNPALRGSSVMFLKPGDQVAVSDLNKGVIIQSGNDACIALADYVAGSQESFIGLMNGYAKKLGLTNTTFQTVHGLDAAGQFSTARDMALLGKALIHDVPEEYAIHKEKEFTFNKIRQPNRNRLLWSTNLNVDGMKTGHTSQAGYNLVASATSPNNMRLISVVMGVPTYKGREVESKKLLQWGFANFETLKTHKANEKISTQSVYYGDKGEVQLGLLQDGFITVPKGKQADLKARYELDNKYLQAPLTKGQVVGKIVYQLDGKDVAIVNLQALEDVQEGGFFGKGWDWLVLTIKGLFD